MIEGDAEDPAGVAALRAVRLLIESLALSGAMTKRASAELLRHLQDEAWMQRVRYENGPEWQLEVANCLEALAERAGQQIDVNWRGTAPARRRRKRTKKPANAPSPAPNTAGPQLVRE